MLEVVSLFIFMCIIYIMIGKLIWESDCKCFFFEDEERKTNVFIEKKKTLKYSMTMMIMNHCLQTTNRRQSN